MESKLNQNLNLIVKLYVEPGKGCLVEVSGCYFSIIVVGRMNLIQYSE